MSCLEDFLKISFKDSKYRNVTHFLLDPSCSSSGMTAVPLNEPAELQQLAKNQKETRQTWESSQKFGSSKVFPMERSWERTCHDFS